MAEQNKYSTTPRDYNHVGEMPQTIATGKALGKVDPTSQLLARDIRNFAWAEDTQESIARFIEWCSILYNFTTDRNDYIDFSVGQMNTMFSDVIKELGEDKDYHSLPEIAGARGGFDKLNDRLNHFAKTFSDGSPSIFYDTLAELKSAYPNGASGVALVRETDPAKIYAWSGTSWESFGDYQGVEIKDGSVTSQKLAENSVSPFNIISNLDSVNILNVDELEVGAWTFEGIGSPVSINSSFTQWLRSPSYYEVQPGDVVRFNRPQQNTYFVGTDNDNNVVQNGTAVTGEPIEKVVTVAEGVTRFYTSIRLQHRDEAIVTINNPLYDSRIKKELNWLKLGTESVTGDNISSQPISTSNKFNKEDVEIGAWIGKIDEPVVTGSTYNTWRRLSKPISVNYGDIVRFSHASSNSYFLGVDEDNVIRQMATGITDDYAPATITVGPNVTKFYTSVREAYLDQAMITINELLPDDYIPYSKTKILEWLDIREGSVRISHLNSEVIDYLNASKTSKYYDTTLLVSGDSITEENYRATKNWHDYLKDELGFGTVINDGKSGTGLVKSFSTSPGLVDRIDDWTTDLDYILIMGAMNDGTSGEFGDATEGLAIGDFTDSPGKQSVYAAAHLMAQKIINKYPNTPVGFITSTPRSQVGARGKCWGIDGWFEEYFEAYSRVMAHYSIPLLDLYHASGLRPWNSDNNAMYFSSDVSPLGDGIHPNALGQEIMSIPIIDFVKRHF